MNVVNRCMTIRRTIESVMRRASPGFAISALKILKT